MSLLDQLRGKKNILPLKILQKIPPSLLILEQPETSGALHYTRKLHISELHHNLPLAQEEFGRLRKDDTIEVCEKPGQNDHQLIFYTRKPLLSKPSETEHWKAISIQAQIRVQVVEELESCWVVKHKGLYAELPKADLKERTTLHSGNSMEVLLMRKDVRRQLWIVGEKQLDIVEKTRPVEDQQVASAVADAHQSRFSYLPEKRLASFEDFSNSYYWEYLEEEEKEIVTEAFKGERALFSEVYRSEVPLYISFHLFEDSAWSKFGKWIVPDLLGKKDVSEAEKQQILKILSSHFFWFSSHFHHASAEQRFNLFNQTLSIYGRVEEDEGLLIITGINHRESSKSLHQKQNALRNVHFALETPLVFLHPYQTPANAEQQQTHLQALHHKAQALDILRKAHGRADTRLQANGRDLLIFRSYLQAQIEYEKKDAEKRKAVRFTGAKLISQPGESVAVRATAQSSVPLEAGNHVVFYAKNESGETDVFQEPLGRGRVIEVEANHANFVCRELDISTIEKGFTAQVIVPTRQHQVQLQVLQQYMNRELDLDHVNQLVHRPKKIQPPETAPVEPINENLKNVAEGDSQLEAVRKGIGNKNIFLIHGPPGTGKTTVITEIVRQLVKNNKKVLVTSQTHIAVDNVLEKLAEESQMGLLRIGRETVIDDAARQFTLEQQLPRYGKLMAKYCSEKRRWINEWLKQHKAETIDVDAFTERERKVFKEWADANELHDRMRTYFRNNWRSFHDSLLSLQPLELRKQRQVLRDWKKLLDESGELAAFLLYRSLDVVFGTCIGVATNKALQESNMEFDVVILDEAGKANISETMVAISKAKKVILVGDHKQLPPYIDQARMEYFLSKEKSKDRYSVDEVQNAIGKSFFEYLVNLSEKGDFPKENIVALTRQFRMHPDISAVVFNSFYKEKQVEDAPDTKKNFIRMPSPLDKQVVFFDTGREKDPFEKRKGNSYINPAEASFILKIIIPELTKVTLSYSDFGILSPYKAQCEYIREEARKMDFPGAEQLQVETLDSYQGKELDVIVFSFCRSSEDRKVGFLDDARRLNVAFSRARKKLILVGNVKTLTSVRSHFQWYYTELFRNLVNHSRNTGNLQQTHTLSKRAGERKRPFGGNKTPQKTNQQSSFSKHNKSRKTNPDWEFKKLAKKYGVGHELITKIVSLDQANNQVKVQIWDTIYVEVTVKPNRMPKKKEGQMFMAIIEAIDLKSKTLQLKEKA